jgi:nucleotide-binding universal stress UspA family protein
MLTIKKILFPTDYSRCADQAFGVAVKFAKQFKAELHLLHAHVPHEADPQSISQLRQAKGEELLSESMKTVIAQAQASGLSITGSIVRDIAVGPVILDYVRANDIDLVVMGTHGRRGLGHLFLGSVAEEVVRFSPCPVLTIKEKKEPSEAGPWQKILVPIDFSKHSEQAVRYAKELAVMFGAELQILHIVEELLHPAFYASGRSSIFEFMPEIEASSVKETNRILKEAGGPEVKFELHLQEGRASRDIVRFAERHGSDLIVIATHGLTGIEHLLLGGVTEKVVRFSSVPVFTVKAFGKSLLGPPDLKELEEIGSGSSRASHT